MVNIRGMLIEPVQVPGSWTTLCPRVNATLQKVNRGAFIWKPTDALVAGVQQLHQWRRRPLGVDLLGGRFIQGQLAQGARRHALHVVHWRVEKLRRKRTRASETKTRKDELRTDRPGVST